MAVRHRVGSRRRRGNLYIQGDGAWDGKRNLSDSYLKLSKRLKVIDWFTPWNHAELDRADIDLARVGRSAAWKDVCRWRQGRQALRD